MGLAMAGRKKRSGRMDPEMLEVLGACTPGSSLPFGRNPAQLAVYVIALENSASCKIGFSNNPGRRCGEIQSSQDRIASVFWACRLKKSDAILLEQEVHQRLTGTINHMRGEWYAIEPGAAVSVVKNAAADLGLVYVPDISFGFASSNLDQR